MDLNHWPLGYEPNELPDCSTPRQNTLIKEKWLGCKDSNLGMPGPKPGALPLGDTPTNNKYKVKEALYKSFLKKSS